jgi:metallo-beta-lactamase family protein
LCKRGFARGSSAGRQRRPVCTEKFRAISGVQESKDLTRSKMPAIIISSSGMATGGRVLHHLKAGLPDSRNTVVLVGFQAEGTRGRRLVNGEKSLRIHGMDVPVHARVEVVNSMSAHADSNEILRWLRGFQSPPKLTFLVHGEATAMQALQQRISKELHWETHMPDWKETVELR